MHEVQEDGSLVELSHASGGDWGGTQVDEAFKQHLIKIVGGNVMRKFSKDSTSEYVDMFREFETKKRSSSDNKEAKVKMKIPVKLLEIFEDETGETVKEAIKQADFDKKLSWVADKLTLKRPLFEGLFSKAIDNTIEHALNILQQPECANTEVIVMIGEFSTCVILQERVKEAFADKRVLIPNYDADLAVLKGAVLYGHNPNVIKSRKSKFTYGVSTNRVFRHGDPEDKKITIGNKNDCKDIFDLHVHKGSTLKEDDAR